MTRHGSGVHSPMWVEDNRPPPVTLPVIAFKQIDAERERKEIAQHLIETRTVKAGVDAWEAIGKAESFEAWKRIGAALSIGKAHALKVSGANAAWGRNYSLAFAEWLKLHPFPHMHASTRSHAIELHENIEAIEKWRASLPQRKRQIINPQSVVKRWKASFKHGNDRSPQDLRRDAIAAWKKFVACIEALPADQAAPLWQTVLIQAVSFTRL